MLAEVEPVLPLFDQPASLAESAKSLHLERIDIRRAVELNQLWHSTLPDLRAITLQMGNLTIAYGAVMDGGVYAIAIWTRPIGGNRMDHPVGHMVELRRLAIPEYAPRFTASWMLGRMEKALHRLDPILCRLLSYQQTDVHKGTIYAAANWHRASVQTSHQSWSEHGRSPGWDQSSAPKVRWERQLRPCSATSEPTP